MYFFDTYALFEIMAGNPSYNKYNDQTISTSVLNIGELYYGLLKRNLHPEIVIAKLDFDLIEIDVETMKQAMRFRYEHKSKDFSMVDCVGYALAQKLGLAFLTGDQAFERIPNVEFVK